MVSNHGPDLCFRGCESSVVIGYFLYLDIDEISELKSYLDIVR